MINVSNKFKQALLDDKRQFQIEATITLIDDTELTITNSELWSQGFEIDTSVSGNNSFDIGGLIIGRMTLVINNIYEDYTQYDFFDADVDVTLTLPFDDGTSESIVFDNFIVDEATDNESQIVLTCLDNAKHFERPYSESNLVYPASVDTIVRDACDTCGVPLLTTSIRNGNYIVPTRPSSDGLTFLKVVSWCAQLTGNFARINNHGQLVVGWYDRNTYDSVNKVNGTEWTITGNVARKFHHIVSWSSLTVGTDDVTVTGLRVVATSSDNTEFVGFYGSEGYVLEVRGNDLIGVSDVQNIANSIGANVVGLKLRTYNGACLGDPTIEASDLIWITDRKNRSYRSLICGTCFKLGQYQNLYCGAATPSRHSAVSYSESTRAIVKTRQEIRKSLADYDSRVSSMAELIARGFGMYFTPVTQQDGSVIPYIHDEPTIEESSYIAYMTSQGIMMESDGSTSAAVDRNGNALLNTLTARGINADWINSGAISIKDTQGNETFYANCLTGEVRINATSFSLTGSTVQQIAQEAVDNIEIGGRNLLLDTNKTVSNTSTESTNGGIVTTSYFYVSDYGKNFTNSEDTVFTVTAWYEFTGDAIDADTRVYAQFHWTVIGNIIGNDGSPSDYMTQTTQSGIYKRTFRLTSAQASPGANKRLRMVFRGAPNGAICTLRVTRLKLEVGNVATDWTPAPEDITNSIDGISIGGRNLLLDSEKEVVSPAYDSATVYTPYYYVSDYGKPYVSEVGTLLTLSCEFEVTGNEADGASFYGQLNNNAISNVSNYGTTTNESIPSSNYSGIYRRSFSVNSTQATNVNKRVRFGLLNATPGTVLKIRKIKLEIGNRVSDWTLAPEDVQSDIDTATSVANDANTTAQQANATAQQANTTAQQANATAQQALDIASSAGGLVAYLDNDYQSVPTDADGNYVTFPECSSKITVFYNSSDVSSQCTYTVVATNGVTGSWNGTTRTYTVTGLSTDSGTVTITAAYDNTSLSKKFTVIKVRQGISGTNGHNGENGRGISSMEEYYAISESNTEAPETWSINVVAPTESNPYLWNYNRIVYDDNTQEDSQPRVIGNYARNGIDGQPGQNGQNGRGITSITEHYGLSNATTTEPTSWSDTMQVPTSSAKYLWNYETIAYTDGTSENTSKRIIGNFGADGKSAYNYELILSDVAIVKDGEGNITPQTITMTAKRGQGTSTPGNYAGRFKVEVTTNGTSYTTAYTSSANEATHTYTPTGNEKNIRVSLYLAGGTSTLLDSQNVPVISDGVDGVSPTITSSKSGSVTTVTITDANGTRTLTINDGTAGASIATVTNYYLASASATGVTTSTSGWTTNPKASGATISASKPYLWNYEVSKDNNNVTIATTSPAVIGHFGKNGTNGTNGADGQDGQDGRGISSITEYYAISESTTAPDDSNFTSEYVLTPDPIHKYLWNYEVIAYTDSTSTRTSKHIIGVYGDPGEAGKDAYTVILSNESHTFAGTGGHAIASSVDCNIIAYKGATRVPATIGTITGTITNKLSVTKTDSGLTTARITVSATNTLDTQSGVLTIPITVDGKSFTKTFSWSVAYNGTDGQNGRGVSLMEEYYAVSASNSTAPDSWSTSVVAPTEEYPYLWNYNRVVYTDNTWEDTLPRVIGNYAKDGDDGEDGQNGRGITSITEHYGLSNATTTEPTSWSNTMQVPTSSAKYLWNYETITYTDGTTENTTKRIIGNYSANGAGAYNYELILSDVAIVKDAEGNITPSTITMTAKRGQGTSTPGNYAGRFKVEVTTNGTSYTTAYTSSANEATHTYTPTGNEKNIRISLYLAGGTATLLDSQNVPIVSDGADGFSPTVVSNKADGVTTVTITDANGTRSFTVNDGTDGASIATVTNYYLASASATGVTTSTSGWSTNPTGSSATITKDKPYLWNYEVSKDNNGKTITTTTPSVIGHFGSDGTNGTNGTNGKDGKGIASIEEYYAIFNSPTSAPSDSQFTKNVVAPTSTSRYLWNYEVVTYTDNSSEKTDKRVIGVYGDPGTSIKTIDNYYLASASATGVTTSTSGWTKDPTNASATISEEKPYLWNYEVTKDNNDQVITTTDPTVIGHYGQTGATGKGIKSITEYYALSNTTTAPDDSSFGLTVKTPSISNRYLWNYEKITYTDDSVTTTSKHIIGVYGDPATTIVLTNESHTFPGDVSNALASSFDCSVFAYSGTTRVPAKIGNITGLPSKGLSVTITNNETTTAKITVSATTELTLQSGTLNIPITVKGKTFTKKLAWSVAYRGRTGEGTPARSYFLDLSSKSVKFGENLHYFPSILTAKAYYRDGASTSQTAYTGYIGVQVCIGTTWSTVKNFNASTVSLSLVSNSTATKATINDSNELTLPLNSTAIRFQLKATSSSTVYFDQQDTIILIDIESLTQEAIFNKLTNNSRDQGVYLENGKVYINAEYIQSWIMKLGGANNRNGFLDVYDANGNLVGYWTKDGIKLGGTLTDVHASTDAPNTFIDVNGKTETKRLVASENIKINGVPQAGIIGSSYDGYFIFPFGWSLYKDDDNYGKFELTENGLDIDTGYGTHIKAGYSSCALSIEDDASEITTFIRNDEIVLNQDEDGDGVTYVGKETHINTDEIRIIEGLTNPEQAVMTTDYIGIGGVTKATSDAYMAKNGHVFGSQFGVASATTDHIASYKFVSASNGEPAQYKLTDSAFKSFMKIRTVSDSVTVTKDSYADSTIYLYNASYNGWYPIAIAGFRASGSSYLSVLQVYLSNGDLKYRLGCRGSSSNVNATFYADILYVRE